MTGIEDLSGLRSSTRYKVQRVIGFLDRTKLPLTGIGVSDIIGIVYTHHVQYAAPVIDIAGVEPEPTPATARQFSH